MKISKFLHFFLSLLLVTSITSCADDEDQISIPVPAVTSTGLQDGKASINIGQTLELRPKLTNRVMARYQWLVNGQPVSTDSIFTFTATERGNFEVSYKVSNPAGESSAKYAIQVWGKYENGFFILNEGLFGSDAGGSVNFFRYDAKAVEANVFAKENTGKALGITTQYGAVHNGKVYFVSKEGPLVVTDAYSLKETGRIANLPAGGRAFLGLDANKGLLSTTNGIYEVNLQPLALGTKVAGINVEVGSLHKEGAHIFALTANDELLVLKASDYSIVKTVAGVSEGFARTPDGALWAAGGNTLLKINTNTLATEAIALPFTAGVSWEWSSWNAGALTASTKENAVFIARTDYGDARKVYKYVAGNNSSLQAPFITIPEGKEFYGAAIRYDKSTDNLVITTMKPGYGENSKYNDLYFYNATTGALKESVSYEGFYFPAMPVFQ
ncbi:DUF5074 domain-containing protein [Pontibacter arcticus]|uniref:Bacteroidetes PKD-like domain-containing protein n=1 Tax=Pontibacter arcticus TaxID=2080288 RepID=A0A364RIM9_9BACT|nr:DUF5074 domain-containing protein [Pontibacter arcticus]RAU84159.1 hypothetical protein DP923_03695 [Pontibacter arcticus]